MDSALESVDKRAVDRVVDEVLRAVDPDREAVDREVVDRGVVDTVVCERDGVVEPAAVADGLGKEVAAETEEAVVG